jgi:hypothetical protein
VIAVLAGVGEVCVDGAREVELGVVGEQAADGLQGAAVDAWCRVGGVGVDRVLGAVEFRHVDAVHGRDRWWTDERTK